MRRAGYGHRHGTWTWTWPWTWMGGVVGDRGDQGRPGQDDDNGNGKITRCQTRRAAQATGCVDEGRNAGCVCGRIEGAGACQRRAGSGVGRSMVAHDRAAHTQAPAPESPRQSSGVAVLQRSAVQQRQREKERAHTHTHTRTHAHADATSDKRASERARDNADATRPGPSGSRARLTMVLSVAALDSRPPPLPLALTYLPA